VALLRGRDFTAADGVSGETPALVDAHFADVHFAGRDAIGQRLVLTPRGNRPDELSGTVTIVGVVANVRQQDPDETVVDPIVYVPYAANPLARASILVRAPATLGGVTTQVRSELAAVDADLPVSDVVTIDELIARELWPLRTFGTMFAIFAAMALIIAGVGLYAVTSRAVLQRTREIGVRMALGAPVGQVWLLLTRRAASQLALGLVLGMSGAMAIGRLLQGALFQTSPTDPVTLTAVVSLLAVVGIAASFVPARRATRVDPVVALRTE
jgi:putative ABC transport system permease protein